MRVQENIVLGKDNRGNLRKAALLLWAESRQLMWGGEGSISRLIQRIADEIITRPEEYGLTREEIDQKCTTMVQGENNAQD